MIYRGFGQTGWQVSTIGLGTWNIGNQWGEIDEVTAQSTIRRAWECGVNLFDTAESYGIPNGLSEERLGRALTGIRHQVYLVSKIGHWGDRTGQGVPKTTIDMVRLCGHAILHRLRTDWVDVMLCHESQLKDPTIYLEGFEALKREGRLRCYGISTDNLEVLKRFNTNNTCSVVEIDYSLLNQAAEKELLPYCQEHGIAVLVRGPLAKGLLAGKYTPDSVFTDSVRSRWTSDAEQHADYVRRVAQVEQIRKTLEPGSNMAETALRYVISHPAQPVAIPGAKSPAQAEMNARAGDKVLATEDFVRLQKLLD